MPKIFPIPLTAPFAFSWDPACGDTKLLLGRELRFVTTVAEQKRSNIQLRQGTTKQEFTTIRKNRDAQLDMPALILPAIQINIRAGEFPEPEANGTAYLKIPLNVF